MKLVYENDQAFVMLSREEFRQMAEPFMQADRRIEIDSQNVYRYTFTIHYKGIDAYRKGFLGQLKDVYDIT